ncbi:unnamed protein product [Natator depressus]
MVASQGVHALLYDKASCLHKLGGGCNIYDVQELLETLINRVRLGRNIYAEVENNIFYETNVLVYVLDFLI